MIKVSLESIQEHLFSKNFAVKFQPETKQLYMVFQIDKKEYPLFIRILSENHFVQLLLFFPGNIKPARFNEIARLLHLINKEIDAPGFCIDEESGYVFYRCMVPAVDQKIDSTLLENFIKASELLCKSFTPVINNVATGALDFKSVLKRSIDEKKSNPAFS